MIRRTLHISWVTVAVLLALVLGAFWYIGWTERGLHTVAHLLSRRVGPVTMHIEGESGTLAGGASVRHFVLDHRRAHIEVDQARLRLAMWPLLWQTIRVESLEADSFKLKVLPRVDDNNEWKPHFLPRLLTLRVERATVAKAELITTRGRVYDVTGLSARGVVHSDSIRVYESALNYSDINVHADGVVSAAQPIGIAGNMRLDSHPEGQPQYAGHASFKGNLDQLPINGEFTQPFSASFAGSAQALSGDWHWSGESELRRLDLRDWNAGGALGVITGHLHLTGNGDGFQARGPLLAPGLEAGPLQTDFDGNYANKQLAVRKLVFLHQPSGTTVAAAGSIGVVKGGPELDLRGTWRTLRWPMAAANAPVHSDAGNYTLKGVWPYRLDAEGDVSIEDLPSMQFQGNGLLYTDRLEIAEAGVDAFNGHALMKGTAWWTPDERWQASGHMNEFDVSSLRPSIRGRLNFDLKASGIGFGAASTMESSFANLGGNVRGQRASGHAHVASEGKDWLLDNVHVVLGATRIDAQGRIGAIPELDFSLKADDLALFSEDAHGVLEAQGKLHGDSAAPRLQLHATGHDLRYGDSGAAHLAADIDFDPHGSGNGESRVRLTGLRVADRSISQLDFATHGRAAAHEVTLKLKAPRLDLNAAGPGAWVNGRWTWQIQRFDTDDQRKLHMQLESPAELRLDASEQQLQPLCLRQQAARFCMSGHHGTVTQFTALAEQLPLGALTAGLSDATEFEGTVGLQLQAATLPSGNWGGQLRAQLNGATAQHRLRSGRVEPFSIGSGSVSADLDNAGLRGRFALDSGAAGHLIGTLQANNSAPAMSDWPLSGELQLESDALSVLDSYITEVDRITGRVAANLQVAGTIGAPEFNGELKVSGGEVDAYQINLALRDLNFVARLKGDTLTLDGSTNAGVDGSANFAGQIAWRGQLPYGSLTLKGKDLRVVNVPEARVQASPDVRLALNGHRIDITGSIDVPYARLEPVQFSNAVLPTGDEVLVNQQRTAPEDQFHVYSNVTLNLGERVTINTRGLSGRLSGSITTSTDESGISRGRGELTVEEGKYTAYARKLDIERGRLNFNNALLSNPALDLRATKRFPDITAGVNVRGTLENPVLSFFSDPATSQAQIISLLLAGGSFDVANQVSNDPGARSSAARNALGLQASAILAAQTGLGAKLGIEDVSIESGIDNTTSVVLGRYLTPRLYLSYGIGIAEAINTLKLRYTIGDHWTLRTESGQARSADLLYSIEK